MNVKVTVTVGRRTVALADVRDARIVSALRATAQQVETRLRAVVCPVHNLPARDVRIHFDASGNADLKYESCCEQLGAAIGRALG